MTFKHMKMGLITRAVLIVTVVGSILSISACYCFITSELVGLVDPQADIAEQQETLQQKALDLTERIYRDPPSDLNVMFLIQLGITLLLVYWQAHWAAIRADAPQQAMAHGLAVGVGVLFTYGVMLLLFVPTLLMIKVVFYIALISVSALAGQVAAGKIARGDVLPDSSGTHSKRKPIIPGVPVGLPPGANPDVYYTMGVSAALGGRVEEARQHFTHVLQIQPRHVQAWLQLANLADTPEQAWNYVLQARAISPDDPDVEKAERVIWPKVAANARRKPGETDDDSPPDAPPSD